jgi:hypothetical protein
VEENSLEVHCLEKNMLSLGALKASGESQVLPKCACALLLPILVHLVRQEALRAETAVSVLLHLYLVPDLTLQIPL